MNFIDFQNAETEHTEPLDDEVEVVKEARWYHVAGAAILFFFWQAIIVPIGKFFKKDQS